MFYPESNQIEDPNLTPHVEAIDKYLASLSGMSIKVIEPSRVAYQLQIPVYALQNVLDYYVTAGLLSKQHYWVCTSQECDGLIVRACHNELLDDDDLADDDEDEVTCDICAEICTEKDVRYSLEKPYINVSQPASIFKPEYTVLIDYYDQFLKAEAAQSDTDIKDTLTTLGNYLIESVDGVTPFCGEITAAADLIDAMHENKNADHEFFAVSHVGPLFLSLYSHWDRSLDAFNLDEFANKVQAFGGKMGFYYAKHCFTGLPLAVLSEVKSTLHKHYNNQILVIPIDAQDLAEVAQGKDFIKIITDRVQQISIW